MPGRSPEKRAKRGQKPRPVPGSTPEIEFERPTAVISRRAGDRIRAGPVWVYQSDVERIFGEPSGLVAVSDSRGIPLGTALYSPASQITLRLVSTELLDNAQWLDLLRARLETAVRMRLPLLDAKTNACRLVFSEADGLPGLVAD